MKNIFLIVLIMFIGRTAVAHSGESSLAASDTVTKFSRLQIGNDTCRIYIQQINTDHLDANLWLIWKGKTAWKTKIDKKKLKKPFVALQKGCPDTSIYEPNPLVLSFKALQNLNFDDLLFTGIEYKGIRANRLSYDILLTSSLTNQVYRFGAAIVYIDEKLAIKRKQEFIIMWNAFLPVSK